MEHASPNLKVPWQDPIGQWTERVEDEQTTQGREESISDRRTQASLLIDPDWCGQSSVFLRAEGTREVL